MLKDNVEYILVKTPDDLYIDEIIQGEAGRHFDRLNFSDLLALASEVCLSRELVVDIDICEDTFERRLIEKLGSRGLGLALDSVAGELRYDPTVSCIADEINETEDDDMIGTYAPLRTPDSFGVSLDMEVQSQIRSFGEALLDEAFLALGSDVEAYIESFKAAKDTEEQMTVLQWLDERLRAITTDERNDDKFYHPIHLSPKLLGSYPDHAFTPTCLGKSIIAASFLHQTGAPLLHAGAMVVGDEYDYALVSNAARHAYEHDSIRADSIFSGRLLEAAENTYYDVENDPGFHAGACVRMLDESWYLIDANFGSAAFDEEMSAGLSKAHADIDEFKRMGIPIERVVQDAHMTAVECGLNGMHDARVLIEDGEIQSMLRDSHPDDIWMTLYKWTVHKMLSMHDHEGVEAAMMHMVLVKDVMNEGLIFSDINRSTVLLESFDTMFRKYVLWGMDQDEFLERASTDAAFFVRRVDDIAALPMLTMYESLSVLYDVHAGEDKGVYQALEIGDPAHRVGAAVLSDFASYCGDDMSYAFWVSNWPGRVPITERLGPQDEPLDFSLGHNNLSWLSIILRYTKQNGIVASSDPSMKG